MAGIKKRRFVDVGHTIEHGMKTYPGIPGPVITDLLTRPDSRKNYAEGTEFSIGKIEMAANTGTYVDSPFHRYENGTDLSELPLESLADIDGIVVRCLVAKGRAISAQNLDHVDVKGKAVLFDTGWDRHWGTETYFHGHPYLTKDAAEFLLREGATLVGIDSLNIDDTGDLTRPVHSILLGANIPIVEHLCNLESVPDSGFKFFAVPVKIRQFGSFPVRAFCLIED
jgi:kynurenine formamidase